MELYKLYKKYYGMIFTLFAILFAVSLGAGETLKKIEIGGIAGIYNTIIAFVPEQQLVVLEQLKIPVVFVWIISLILFLWKKRMNILCHSSFALGLAPLSKDIEKEYSVKKTDLDLTRYSYPKDLPQAISEQDLILKKFISKKGELSYYGIAHTPLIFRAGYIFGDQRKICLFHRKRSNDAVFEEWDTSPHINMWETSFKEVKEENKSCKSKELIVAISTSLEIKDADIETLSNKKYHIIKFQTQTLNFDLIGNYDQAEILRKQILTKIRELVKQYDIRCIHMLISSSVAFTFFLGTAFSFQHDPDIIVYHYENGKYTWGLDMKKSGTNAVISL